MSKTEKEIEEMFEKIEAELICLVNVTPANESQSKTEKVAFNVASLPALLKALEVLGDGFAFDGSKEREEPWFTVTMKVTKE